jgi:paraquat-inducible protein B
LNKIIKEISESLVVDKTDKKNNITMVKYTNGDEIFTKVFVEQLVGNALNFYTDYKSKRSRQNVRILQKQADSVKALLTGGIVDIATTSDLNINPLRQITRAPLQRKQVDVQVNGKLYEEILKQLELAKITMRRETPLVQVIDTPRYPLEKKKMGRLKGGVIFGIIGLFLALTFLLLRKFFRG